MTVLDHTFDVETFHTDDAVFGGKLRTDLVQVVPPLVANALVAFRNGSLSFVPILSLRLTLSNLAALVIVDVL